MTSSETMQQLFSKYPVEEIRQLEKKTRNEIETKKEDLRQMVGERYRDLIEAADTIAEMKKCSAGVKDSVHRIQKYTSTELKSGKFVQAATKNNTSTINRYMQLSSQVKLLMEMSETIWSRVEGGDMIEATHLYMQSRQVLKNLSLDGSTTYCPILQWFPVLGQQAQALDNLRSTILSECRRQLRDSNLNSKPLSEALCSIILLEESDVTKAFPEFMEARFSAINSKFDGSLGDSIDETGSTKLCKVVTLLVATIKQAYKLFVAPVKVPEVDDKNTKSSRRKSTLSQAKEQATNAGLVSHVLRESYRSFAEKCTDYEKSGSIHEERLWCKHLPESVSKLTSLHQGSKNISIPFPLIQSTCQEWLKKCKLSIQNGTLKLLSFITTFKGLATLRQSLWDTLNEVSDAQKGQEENWKTGTLESGDSTVSEWEEACLSTLGRRLLLWDEILKSLFLDKVKSLSKNLFIGLLTSGKDRLNDVLDNLKRTDRKIACDSTSKFIWHELPSDILPDTAWKQVSIRKGREVKGGLGLKALTVTPTLHNVCVQLSTSMREVLSDLFNYIPEARKEENKSTVQNKATKSARITPVVDKDEMTTICSYFQKSCSKCLREFLKELSSYEKSLVERLMTERSSVDEILFLAMFCQNFCQLCNEFQTGCMIAEERHSPPLKKQLSNPTGSMTSSMMSQSLHQPAVSPIWEEIREGMSLQSRKFLKLWSEATIKKAVSSFKAETQKLDCGVDLFDSIPTWDNVAIQEESEAGSKVESEIKIPMTVSWPVLELLYTVCENISRVGGHSLSRSMLQDITRTCLHGVLQTFVELKNKVTENDGSKIDKDTSGMCPFIPTQPWALQKLFDLRMLHGLLHSTLQSSEKSKKSEKPLFEVKEDSFSELVDWLEGYIDPFDLDVFAPHLTRNIQRSIHCSAVMLGFVTPSDKSDTLHSTHSMSKTSGGNSHNILPLTTDCGRFSYLPISNRMSKSDKVPLPASIKSHLPLSAALKQITETEKRKMGGEGRKQSLYSKLGALSSSWLSMATSDN